MMVVIVEFELREGSESEFETALQQMQQQVRKYDGFLGEMSCRSIENEKTFVTSSIGAIASRSKHGGKIASI